MVETNDSPEFSIVKILRKDGGVAGAGSLIGKKWVLTCKHVITSIFPDDNFTIEPFQYKVDLTFYLDNSKKILKSHVSFLPPKDEDIDFVILKLEDEAPSCACVGKILNKTFWWRDNLSACGFSIDGEAKWVSLIGMGPVNPTSVQIDISKDTGYPIEEGFSGTPVLDIESKRIIGIIAAKENADGVLSGVYVSINSILNIYKKYYSVDKDAFENIEMEAPTSSYKLWHVPPAPDHYVERPEITQEITKNILNGRSSQSGLVIGAIHGLGGIGKSALISHLIINSEKSKEIRSCFSDGVLWVTLGQKPERHRLLVDLIQGVGDFNFHSTTEDEASNYLRAMLMDKSFLLIIDDAWNSKDVKPFLVGGSHCQALITTRESIIANDIGAALFELNVMTEDQSVELLSNYLKKS